MTDTKPTIDEQIAGIKHLLVTDSAIANNYWASVFASLEELKRIECVKVPVEPTELTMIRGLAGNDPITDYIDELLAHAKRKDAELSDAVHLNDEQAQRVFRAEAEALSKQAAIDMLNRMNDQLEQEKAALLDALKKLTLAAENIGGEHVTGWQALLDACVTSEQVILKVNEAKNG
jgi:hypothetical protein